MARLITLLPKPPEPVPVSGIQLELTTDEAQTLEAVLSCISGPPRASRRGLCDNILRVLQAAEELPKQSHDDLQGSLGFKRMM